MKISRLTVTMTALALSGLLNIGAMGLAAATTEPASSNAALRTITGHVLNIEGELYAVKDVSGHEVLDRKSTRLNSSHSRASRMPSSA